MKASRVFWSIAVPIGLLLACWSIVSFLEWLSVDVVGTIVLFGVLAGALSMAAYLVWTWEGWDDDQL